MDDCARSVRFDGVGTSFVLKVPVASNASFAALAGAHCGSFHIHRRRQTYRTSELRWNKGSKIFAQRKTAG